MTTERRALVVDDERDIRELLVLTLNRMGLRVDTAADRASAIRLLGEERFDFCLTDMRLPDGSGMDIIQHIAQHHPNLPVAMITAFGNVEAAVEALKAGAFDFVTKPVDLSVLRRLVQQALSINDARRSQAEASSARLIGDSPRMQQLRTMMGKVSRSQAPVYISGESGVGKELVARTIHEQGPRASGPFIPVNCGAIPTELMESELFGHKKGSFTGAHADKDGLFQAANGGTLFLDEVAELPLHMQVKLLRVIQEKSVRPVGAAAEIPVDVRILSATHKPLAKMVEDGRFRHDLYYRINVIELPVPPLRERREDILPIAQAVLGKLAQEYGEAPARLGSATQTALQSYDFPGNVRELENMLERALALCEQQRIEPADLCLPTPVASAAVATDIPIATHEQVPGASPSSPASSASGTTSPRVTDSQALPLALEQIERETITKALDAHRWNKTKTAESLGITFRALRYKLKKLGID